jgi:hypothetical protein
MKIAALISGEPRFCEEFDIQLSSLTVEYPIDWFFLIWQKNDKIHHTGYDIVAPFWKNVEYNSAYQKIEQYLPHNHKIINLTVENKDNYSINFTPKHKSKETNPDYVWLKFNGFYHVNQIRKKYLESYDLIIMTRPDISIEPKLNFDEIKDILDKHPNSIMTPKRDSGGWLGKYINDNFIIAKPEQMDIFCDHIHYIPKFQEENFLFHPETMLAEFSHRKNLNVIRHNIDYQLRALGTNVGRDNYISKFGRWA